MCKAARTRRPSFPRTWPSGAHRCPQAGTTKSRPAVAASHNVYASEHPLPSACDGRPSSEATRRIARADDSRPRTTTEGIVSRKIPIKSGPQSLVLDAGPPAEPSSCICALCRVRSHGQISTMERRRMAHRRVGRFAHAKGRAQRSAQQQLPRHGFRVVHRPLTTVWGVLKKERANVRFPSSST